MTQATAGQGNLFAQVLDPANRPVLALRPPAREPGLFAE
jgi:hypothetical protein